MTSDIPDAVLMGRGVVATRRGPQRAQQLPERSEYIRACFAAYYSLQVVQDTSLLNHESQGEPLWENNRFKIEHLPPGTQWQWEYYLETYRISDLAERGTGRPFTAHEWSGFIDQMAPAGQSDAEEQRWADERRRDWPAIQASVPKALTQEMNKPPPAHADGDVVKTVDEHSGREHYARVQILAATPQIELHELWLDTSGYPHETGRKLRYADQISVERAAVWTAMNKQYKQPYRGDEENAEPETRSAVMGSVTETFPLNDGWHLKGTDARKQDGKPKRLSELTIHEITARLTGIKMAGARPNCEAAWEQRLPHPAQLKAAWPKIWRSLGTPLTDPTEEKSWGRLLHRATDAKNRYPRGQHDCRLRCGCKDESMLHMVKCPLLSRFWRECFDFCRDVLKEPKDMDATWSAIFNLSTRHEPLSVLTCAFLRHAVRWWYAALTDIKEKGKGTFVREHVMCTTLERFQDAVVRYARSIRQHYVQRRFTNLEGHVAEKTRRQFEAVVHIELDGKYSLTNALKRAVAAARRESERVREAAAQNRAG